MLKEPRFTALACTGCERTKPTEEVTWEITFWYKDENKDRRNVGFLLGSEVDYYAKKGQVTKTLSSATCPQCAADGLYNGSLEDLRKAWSISDPKWPQKETEDWFKRYFKFLKRVGKL
jgi:hypothetical protein